METVAGITAMQDLASRAGISLAEGTEPVTLVPLNGGVSALDQALAGRGAVVGYKVGAAASPAPAILRDRLHAAGRLDGAVVGARLGLPGELIAPAAEVLRPAEADAPAFDPAAPATTDIPDIPYLSTLIAPVPRTTRGASLAQEVPAQPARCSIEPVLAGSMFHRVGRNPRAGQRTEARGAGVLRGSRVPGRRTC